MQAETILSLHTRGRDLGVRHLAAVLFPSYPNPFSRRVSNHVHDFPVPKCIFLEFILPRY